MHIAAIGTKVDDRVPNELAGSVVGDVAAASRHVDFNAAVREQLAAREDMRAPAVALHPERQHMRMLHEQEHVVDMSRPTLLDQLALKRERLAVRNHPETSDD
jgi:hypothetical protein